MSKNSYDICVLGGGPGGYVAAIRAAQLGAKVVLIEKDEVGGTCLNRGCIPTKTYLKHAKIINELQRIDSYGIKIDGYHINWTQMKKRKNGVVSRLNKGVEMLLKKNGVELVKGKGKVIDQNRVITEGEDTFELRCKKLILATGSKPVIPKIKGVKHPAVITSREALDLEDLPGRLIIIGGGVIGVELATVFNSLGVEVTIVEMMDQLLPGTAGEIAELLEKKLKQQGVNIYTGAEVTEIKDKAGNLQVEMITTGNKEKLGTDKVLLAVGRQANFQGLDNLKLKTKNGFVVTDDAMRTSYQNIYAIGDLTGGPLLAHVASAEGIVAAENAAGEQKTMDYTAVPKCVYTIPEIATVGLSEGEAAKKGYRVKTGQFPFTANGKALTSGNKEGFIKVITDERWDQILGIEIVGSHATELIAEAVLAIRLEATSKMLGETIHPHPTFSEAMMEAAENVRGLSIHI